MAEGRVISIWFDNGLIDRVDEVAEEMGVPRSALVKDVLRREFETPSPGAESHP